MFNFTPPEPPTNKHHLHNHPNPVTVAELTDRERTEQPTDATHTHTLTTGE